MKFFFLLFLGVSVFFAKGVFSKETFDIHTKEYFDTTVFEIYSEGDLTHKLESYYFQLRTCYELNDLCGETAKGTARFFSMGTLLNCMKVIDIVDSREDTIGLIDGEFWTSAKGKFSFYDSSNIHFATAYVDLSGTTVSIFDAEDTEERIAVLNCFSSAGGSPKWRVEVFEEEKIDPRMLQIFTAFVSDIYRFLPPRSEVHLHFQQNNY